MKNSYVILESTFGSKVRMFLTCTDTSMDLNRLAGMADKNMEVATPIVSTISDTHTDSSEVKQLCEEVAAWLTSSHH